MEKIKQPETNFIAREVPESLKTVLKKLPTPEAIQILEDIGRTAWVIDNNNNNNTSSAIEKRIIQRVSEMPPDKLSKILSEKI